MSNNSPEIPSSKGNISISAPYVSPKKGRRVRDKLEVSPTGRASCQRCGEEIAKGEIRVGIQGKITTLQGVDVWRMQYWHEGCVNESTNRALFLAPSESSKAGRASGKKEMTALSAKNEKKNVVSPDKKPSSKAKSKSSADESRKSLLKPHVCKQVEQDLRALRKSFARTQDCEEYKIFQNRSLKELLTKLPTNEAELKRCWGIKGKRCDQYGDSILKVIKYYLRQESGQVVRQKQNNQPRRLSTTPSSSKNNDASATTRSPVKRRMNGNVAASMKSAPVSYDSNSDNDSESDIESGSTLSIEELVSQRVREAEARGEVLEIL